ncbi:SspB family protein [Oceanicella actignis]|uniref:Stringent starvation protein B n=1 Tax=Oceanicella actignis TaxID=1189325 RepID=A0A1M7TNR7_9RHOB|nr:ClpXP protease specificity-enhancing factor SspB [Oceanicella actignis]TYO85226.1 hypothetical protein LY05_02652 [Oceanicella actignis]SET73082.1 hypothetical protein SAMN04488119_10880 [Oceanicella actignis]SHN72391.1 hypothetical protein SAMN05216200_10881 [Oceanicella actignis]
MSQAGLDYGKMMQRALRGVMAESLGVAAREGLPGGHHFYITFDTRHPGVDMPDWLRAQFPEEITIVIQHEFWDLAVTPDRFSVGLSFSNRAATLVVPFDAVTTFVDPHAEFGLKFDAHDAEDDEGPEPGPGDGPGAEAEPPSPPAPGGDVVSLDRFRKR